MSALAMFVRLSILAIVLASVATIFLISRTVIRIITTVNIGLPTLTDDIDKDQWNARWESYFITLGSLPDPIFIYQLVSRLCFWGHNDAMESQLYRLRVSLREICFLQRNLTEMTLHAIVRDRLESRWQGIGEAMRAEHLLEGLARTCAQPKGVELVRIFCPELTLAKMQEEGGQAFLRLLKYYILDNSSVVPRQPLFLPNSRFDYPQDSRVQESEFDAVIREELNVDRNTFICQFSLNLLYTPINI